MFRSKSKSGTNILSRAQENRSASKLEALQDISGALPSTFTDGLPLPKLFVFDLDYTLWPFWVDTHVTPPLKAGEGGKWVKDNYGEKFAFYDEVPNVLAGLKQLSIQVAAASRTHAPDLGREMLKLLRIPSKPSSSTLTHTATNATTNSSNTATSLTRSEASSSSTTKAIEFFQHLQIYPGSKIKHFEKLANTTSLDFEEMLFFDDESRNKEVETLGVVMWLVRDGVSNDEIDKGVLSWRKRNRRDVK